MTRLEPGFLVLSVLVYCFFRKQHRKSMIVDLVNRPASRRRACSCCWRGRRHRGPGAGRAEPPLLVLALMGQARQLIIGGRVSLVLFVGRVLMHRRVDGVEVV